MSPGTPVYRGTTKGLFLAHFLKLAKQRLPAAEVDTMGREAGMPPRISPFVSYSIIPLTAFQELLAQRIFPHIELVEGMRRLGHDAFHAFAESVTGRVVTALVVRDVPHVASLIEHAYRSVNDLGEVRTRLLSPSEFVIEFSEYRQYPEHQHGLLSEGCAHLRWPLRPELTIRSFRRGGPGHVVADFDIRMSDTSFST